MAVRRVRGPGIGSTRTVTCPGSGYDRVDLDALACDEGRRRAGEKAAAAAMSWGRPPRHSGTSAAYAAGESGLASACRSTGIQRGVIRATALVMSAEKDLYFPPEDDSWAVSRGAVDRPYPCTAGHGDRVPWRHHN
ncbi:hypothetical protein ACFPH6_03790, partial [Streptomyces xiangluensis]